MNARKIISAAFYELLQKYTVEEISVEQITRSAEVSKPTFYRYYRDKYDLLNQMFDVMFEPMREAERSVSWGEAMRQVLENLEQNLKFFQNGVQSNDQHSLHNYHLDCVSDAVTDVLTRRGVDVTAEELLFAIRACAITQTEAVTGWVCDEHRMPKETFVRLLKASLPHNLYPYFTI